MEERKKSCLPTETPLRVDGAWEAGGHMGTDGGHMGTDGGHMGTDGGLRAGKARLSLRVMSKCKTTPGP